MYEDSNEQQIPEEPYYDPHPTYEPPQLEETGQYQWEIDDAMQPPPPDVISTSQAINLTATLASMSTLFAIFLLFADQRSRAVRRFSVQSAGLGIIHIAIGVLCWLISTLLSLIPLLGYILVLIMTLLFLAVTAMVIIQRVRMMYHAYRGIAFTLPLIGEKLRKFE